VNTVLKNNFLRPDEEFHSQIVESLKREISHYDSQIVGLEAINKEHFGDILKSDIEIQERLQVDKEKNKTIIHHLHQLRVDLKNKMEENDRLIGELRKKIQYIQMVEQDFRYWKEMHKSFMNDNDITPLRRLALYLLQKISVDEHGNLLLSPVIKLDNL
jgi:predicted RNase H-like nuclease (RuvC/YqgF family)